MAKTSTRRVTIYINGKEVEASVKQIRAEMLAYIAGKLGISSKELVQQFVEAADIINVSMGDVLGDDATLAIGKMVDVYTKISLSRFCPDSKAKISKLRL